MWNCRVRALKPATTSNYGFLDLREVQNFGHVLRKCSDSVRDSVGVDVGNLRCRRTRKVTVVAQAFVPRALAMRSPNTHQKDWILVL